MPLSLSGYDPTKQIITYNGVNIDGYGPGTFINVSRTEETWIFYPSNSGGGGRARNQNSSGRFEFTLLASSPSNATLAAFADADEFRGEGVGELFIKDRSARKALCFALSAWIVKPPDYERARELGTITWTIETDSIRIVHDGLVPL